MALVSLSQLSFIAIEQAAVILPFINVARPCKGIVLLSQSITSNPRLARELIESTATLILEVNYDNLNVTAALIIQKLNSQEFKSLLESLLPQGTFFSDSTISAVENSSSDSDTSSSSSSVANWIIPVVIVCILLAGLIAFVVVRQRRINERSVSTGRSTGRSDTVQLESTSIAFENPLYQANVAVTDLSEKTLNSTAVNLRRNRQSVILHGFDGRSDSDSEAVVIPGGTNRQSYIEAKRSATMDRTNYMYASPDELGEWSENSYSGGSMLTNPLYTTNKKDYLDIDPAVIANEVHDYRHNVLSSSASAKAPTTPTEGSVISDVCVLNATSPDHYKYINTSASTEVDDSLYATMSKTSDNLEALYATASNEIDECAAGNVPKYAAASNNDEYAAGNVPEYAAASNNDVPVSTASFASQIFSSEASAYESLDGDQKPSNY